MSSISTDGVLHIADQDEIVETEQSVGWTASWISLWILYALTVVACSYPIFQERRQRFRPHEGSVQPESHQASSGDTTRQLFYRLLLFACTSRLLCIPVQISLRRQSSKLGIDTPAWIWWMIWNAEAFPYLAYASAWALLVTFLVQLVGTVVMPASYLPPPAAAVGSLGSNSSVQYTPATATADAEFFSTLPHIVAYTIYVGLSLMDLLWNDAAASILLYALLCCIYAALFGTLVYYGPRLLRILGPSLQRRVGLAWRLVTSLVLLLIILLARTIGLAAKVVLLAPPSTLVRWWWWYDYGVLELFPTVALLVMMHRTSGTSGGGGNAANNQNSKSTSKKSPNAAPGTTPSTTPPTVSPATIPIDQRLQRHHSADVEGQPLLFVPTTSNFGRNDYYGATKTLS